MPQLARSSNSKFLIGIDPGRNTGVCVYDRNGKDILCLETLTFWETIEMLEDFPRWFGRQAFYCKPGEEDKMRPERDELRSFEIVIEDPQLNTPVFMKRHGGHKEIVKMDIAQKVGRNKEQAFLLIEYMKLHNINFRQIRPVKSKWDIKMFWRITFWTKRTNEHERDACRLVWGL